MSIFMYKNEKITNDQNLKKVPYGNASISDIGDGTITGNIRRIGSTSISTIGDGTITGAISALNNKLGTSIVSTLTAGETTLVITNAAITTNMAGIDIYTSKYGFGPSDVETTTGQITMTFDSAAQENVDIKVILLGGE